MRISCQLAYTVCSPCLGLRDIEGEGESEKERDGWREIAGERARGGSSLLFRGALKERGKEATAAEAVANDETADLPIHLSNSSTKLVCLTHTCSLSLFSPALPLSLTLTLCS